MIMCYHIRCLSLLLRVLYPRGRAKGNLVLFRAVPGISVWMQQILLIFESFYSLHPNVFDPRLRTAGS